MTEANDPVLAWTGPAVWGSADFTIVYIVYCIMMGTAAEATERGGPFE